MGASLQKLKNLALFDVGGLFFIGVPGVLLGIVFRDGATFAIGFLLTGLGVIAHRGFILLKQASLAARYWLAGAQLGLLTVVTVYCLWQLTSPPLSPLQMLSPTMLDFVRNLPGYDEDLIVSIIPLATRVTYLIVLVTTLLYQGFMAIYYWKKIPRAIQLPPPLPSNIKEG